MKNEKIVGSWSKIEPDQTAQERMLNNILDRVHSEKTQIGKVSTKVKKPYWKVLTPIAACLVIAVAITAIFGNNAGWFDGKVYTAELNGGTLNFHKKSVGAGSMALELGIDGTARDLTAEENALLFGEIFGINFVFSHGLFSIGDKYGPDETLLHVEAKLVTEQGGTDCSMKIIIAASSLGYTTDTLIEIGSNFSEINGVEVSAGYWITHANSRGERNIIYRAAYETNGVTVYVECGGSLERSDEIRKEISLAIDILTRIGTPNISAIRFDTVE